MFFKHPFSILTTIAAAAFFTALSPAHAVNLGQAYTVGTTWFFTQQNSTVGKSIERDEDEGCHFVWTKGHDAGNQTRHVWFNFCDDNVNTPLAAQLEHNAAIIDEGDRAGYVSLDLIPRPRGAVAAAFYHIFGQGAMSVDFDRGAGAFSAVNFSGPNQTIPISFKGTINRAGRAHVTAVIHSMGGDAIFPLILWQADPVGDNWRVSQPLTVEQCTGITHNIRASRTSDRAAMVWHHNRIGVPAPDEWDGRLAWTMENDLYIYESPDGRDWDFDNAFNITRTIPPNADLPGDYAYGDTLRPYGDCDLIYVGDVVHVVFSTRGLWRDPFLEIVPPVERLTEEESFIWHWDSESDTLTLVADGWYENDGNPGDLLNNVARPSLGAAEDGSLFCIFRQVTEDDVSPSGYCYGEIMLAVSTDGGISWSEAVNLTGTAAENEEELEFVDECFPSLAERVDNDLHLQYLLAPESDSSPMEAGLPEEALIIYHRVALADLPDLQPLPLPREGFQYHRGEPVAVRDSDSQLYPYVFRVESAHPNPFNAYVNLSCRLVKDAPLRWQAWDVNGRLQAAGSLPGTAGVNHLSLNAESWPAGIYLLQIHTETETQTIKLVCVK